MRDGPVALCDGNPQRNALGRKTARSSEDKNTEHEAREIQDCDG
jgi:hypothetical protein